MRRGTVCWAVLICSVAMLVQGCAFQEKLQYFLQEQKESGQSDEFHENREERTYEPDPPKEDKPEQVRREVSELYYAYHCLDEEKQKIYLEVYDALSGLKSGVPLSTVDKSVLDVVFACVMNDHPELFYVEGYQYTEYTLGSTTTGITFSGTYSMTSVQMQQTGQMIEQKLEACFQDVPLNEDEYSTVKYLYEWIINNTEYDKTVDNNQNICSVFLEGRSVCQGYAKAMQYMLQRAGIQCLLVTGFTNGERHGWNLVRVNGAYYYLDPTWGDASYASGSSGSAAGGFAPAINYDYFLVTTDEITRTHSIEKVVELPQCISVDDNYFVREGLYFEDYDEGKFAAILDSETVSAAGCVTVKCGSMETYTQMVQSLVDSQKIFDFVDKRGESIAYTSNDQQRTISFWNL